MLGKVADYIINRTLHGWLEDINDFDLLVLKTIMFALSCFISDKTLNQFPARVLNSTWRPKLHIANISLSPFNRKPQFVTTYPPKVILFEGILVLYHKEIRDLLDMKLFVDCDSDTRLSRRGMNEFFVNSDHQYPTQNHRSN